MNDFVDPKALEREATKRTLAHISTRDLISELNDRGIVQWAYCERKVPLEAVQSLGEDGARAIERAELAMTIARDPKFVEMIEFDETDDPWSSNVMTGLIKKHSARVYMLIPPGRAAELLQGPPAS